MVAAAEAREADQQTLRIESTGNAPQGAAMNAQELATATETATDIVTAFNAKANEVAKENGWTLAHTVTVMLAFLNDTDPDAARTIKAALVVETASGR